MSAFTKVFCYLYGLVGGVAGALGGSKRHRRQCVAPASPPSDAENEAALRERMEAMAPSAERTASLLANRRPPQSWYDESEYPFERTSKP
jgi:hypothetical protein